MKPIIAKIAVLAGLVLIPCGSAQAEVNWGPWQQLKDGRQDAIDIRVGRSENNFWHQFRNRYNRKVWFNFEYAFKGGRKSSGRIELDAGAIENEAGNWESQPLDEVTLSKVTFTEWSWQKE